MQAQRQSGKAVKQKRSKARAEQEMVEHAHAGERIIFQRNGVPFVALIGVEDLAYLRLHKPQPSTEEIEERAKLIAAGRTKTQGWGEA